jgi:hypothetical protein
VIESYDFSDFVHTNPLSGHGSIPSELDFSKEIVVNFMRIRESDLSENDSGGRPKSGKPFSGLGGRLFPD